MVENSRLILDLKAIYNTQTVCEDPFGRRTAAPVDLSGRRRAVAREISAVVTGEVNFAASLDDYLPSEKDMDEKVLPQYLRDLNNVPCKRLHDYPEED